MSVLLLPSGLEVASAYLPEVGTLSRDDESERHRVWLYPALDPNTRGDGVTMEYAIDDLRRAFSEPTVVGAFVVKRFQRRLQTFASRNVPQDRFDLSGKPSQFRLQPSLGAVLEGLIPLAPDDFEPTAELLNQAVSRADLIGFASYVMTNTALQDEGDPRQVLIDELRAKVTTV